MVLKPKRQLWVPSKPAIIVPRRRPIPVVRPPIIPARRIFPITSAVSFGTSGNLTPLSGAGGTTLSASINIGTLTNGALLVYLTGNTTLAANITAFTYAGASITGKLIASGGPSSGAGTNLLYGVVAPANGSNTLSVTVNTTDNLGIGWWSFNGVDQTGGTTTFYNGVYSAGTGAQTSRNPSQATNNGDATVFGWQGGVGFSGTQTPVADWTFIPNFQNEGQHQLSTSSSDSYLATISSSDQLDYVATSIKAVAAGAVVEEDNSRIPNRYWQGWTPNASLIRGTAQDFSSPGVETNPHWRPWTRPAQWNPLAALQQNAAVDVPPVITPDTPPPFRPSSWPLQWNRDWRLFRTTAQDFSSFGVETNPHWINRPWPVQWAPLSLLRATPNDAPAPVTPETNTFFTPRTFPLQWLLQPSLRQTTAQDFSFVGVATSVHLIPRQWPLQWSLQASLMRGTAQDFSTTPPATNPVYARYGAAHGIGMLSAIPGEIPS